MTKLYEANNHILICTETLQPAEHSHMAAHIIISMDGSMKAQCTGAEYLCHGILVPSGISHAIDTQGNTVLVFLYDCTTDVAKQIREVTCIPEEICKEIVRCDALDRVFIALDYFDASINRISAWVVGYRSMAKALLNALCTPSAYLKELQDTCQFSRKMAVMEDCQNRMQALKMFFKIPTGF